MPRDKEEYNAYLREYMRKQYHANAEWVRELKVERGCADCGYNEHHAGLEFDHRESRGNDPKKAIANLLSKSRKRLEAEIALCDVVCRTCHGIRTWNRLQDKRP